MSKLAIYGGKKAISVQQSHYKWPLIGEKEIRAVTGYLRAGRPLSIPGRDGIYTDLEEKFRKYHKSKYAILTNSGTSALHSAFFGIGIKKGDEVIAPTNTFHSTVMPIFQCGGTPVLCDCQPETGNIDPLDIEKSITKKTKAVVVTHLWGHPVELRQITKLAKQHGLALVEDCSHAHGATYDGKKVGTFGNAGCFSFQARKILPAGEGGILITNDREIFERATLLGHFGERSKQTVKSKFYRKFFETGYGLKYRMHPLAAVIANIEFDRLETRIRMRKSNTDYLSKRLKQLKGIEPPITKPNVTRGAFHRYTPSYIKSELNNTPLDRYIGILKAEGMKIDRSDILPLHLLPFFQTRKDGFFGMELNKSKKIYKKGVFPKSEAYYDSIFRIPSFIEPAKRIIDQYIEAFEKVSNALAK